MFKDVAIVCCLCESNGWSVDHFLLNFLVVRDIWFFEFSISSVSCVIPFRCLLVGNVDLIGVRF